VASMPLSTGSIVTPAYASDGSGCLSKPRIHWRHLDYQ
jgi:hypothetical protein